MKYKITYMIIEKQSIAAIAVTLIAIMATGCINHSTQSEKKIIPVETEKVEIYSGDRTNTYYGKVRPADNADLAFKVSGQILKIAVKEGQYVHSGDLLAEIDPRDYKIQLSATEAEYSQIKAEADRVIELHNRGSVAQSDYEKAVYGLQQIEAKLNAHRNALADTKLKAPFDGYVQKLNYTKGETVGAGYPVVVLYNNSTLEVVIHIPNEEYERRNDFKSFNATIGNTATPLTLISIQPQANLNQLFAVRLKVANGNKNIVAGMVATVVIDYKTDAETRLSVPLTAIVRQDDGCKVWIVDNDNTLSLRAIRTGKVCSNGHVIVEGEIAEGESVVIGGVHSLNEGDKVRPLPHSSETNIGGLL
ncbi:MAG: efflux RND transporter periplasmic adaptor subunit [Bacteroidales bacterium]